MPESNSESKPEYDPTYLHSLREAYTIIALFALFFIWSIFVCYNYGYLSPGEQLSEVSTVMGMPAWAFWGIGFPWVLVDVVAVWFCFFYMKNDDLGEAHEGEDLAEQIAHLHDREEAHGE
ncbi:MAG: hypothetical protein H6822_04290 [Planctomycetaceae bacterium]|nr:hypothetical protein [Planctomycetales bacterium]MCB9921373.1 hypothetical protein [Planctomycetaceae bacterium]